MAKLRPDIQDQATCLLGLQQVGYDPKDEDELVKDLFKYTACEFRRLNKVVKINDRLVAYAILKEFKIDTKTTKSVDRLLGDSASGVTAGKIAFSIQKARDNIKEGE